MRIGDRGTWGWSDHRDLDDNEKRSYIDKDSVKRMTIWWFVK